MRNVSLSEHDITVLARDAASQAMSYHRLSKQEGVLPSTAIRLIERGRESFELSKKLWSIIED